MKNKKTPIYLTFLLVLLLYSTHNAWAQKSKPAEKFEKKIDQQGAKSVSVDLKQSTGTLNITSGSGQLMESVFSFSEDEWKPQVAYTIQNGKGKLTVHQPETENLNMNDDDRNDWQVRLSNKVPTDMKLRVGAGESTINLQGMQLTNLQLEAGAGSFTVNLSNTSLPQLKVNAGVGEMKLDLTGKWNNNLEAEINGGIGEVTIRLPSKTGVKIEVNGLGSIDTKGLKKEDGFYINDAYKKGGNTLNIRINGGLGSVNLALD